MKREINENVYKEANYGKKALTTTSIIFVVISIVALVGGIALFVNGCISSGVGSKIWKIVLAVVLLAIGGILGYASVMALFTSFGMMNNNEGNVKDGNRAKGTINVFKCDKCGHENDVKAEFCKNCGASLADYKECECGTRNPKDAEFCIACGKELKK